MVTKKGSWKHWFVIILLVALAFLYIQEFISYNYLLTSYKTALREKDEMYINLLEMKEDIDYCELRVDRFMMYYNNTYGKQYNKTYPDGISFGKYFCIWTEGRDYEEVMETCNHEWLHSRVGKEHFCG